ncbi:hypothetical protein [Paraliobacillus zengyii]|uniref:hypothetical protein n=1 Tax=Paraliobacillus zengyii TaxID=2213194 RepID=UPI000DD307EC|nr:hypothetical protein [Paraliobacillus zengyii]
MNYNLQVKGLISMSRSEKQRRYYIILVITPLIIATFTYFFKESISNAFYINITALDLFSGVFYVLTVLGTLMLYLQTGFKKSSLLEINGSNDSVQNSQDVENLKLELNNIREKLNNLEKHSNVSSSNLNKEKLEEIQEIIKSKIIDETNDKFIKKLEEKVEDNQFQNKVEQSFFNTLNRLKREIGTLNTRSNLNLAIGITVTGVGLYLLYLFVFKGNLESANDTLSFIVQFVPKLSLVIFIEVFAFFFLSLYKTSLAEIKYYQNEMTKIETKYLALVTALELKSEDITLEILREFSSIGHNGQVEENRGNGDIQIQQDKLKADNMVEILAKIIDTYKKS